MKLESNESLNSLCDQVKLNNEFYRLVSRCLTFSKGFRIPGQLDLLTKEIGYATLKKKYCTSSSLLLTDVYYPDYEATIRPNSKSNFE